MCFFKHSMENAGLESRSSERAQWIAAPWERQSVPIIIRRSQHMHGLLEAFLMGLAVDSPDGEQCPSFPF